MSRPWLPELLVSPELARDLIEEQFPELRPARPEPFGEGWDNTAYLVGGEWVFRFPRREIAVDLIRAELAVLPAVAPHLPLPVPVPCWAGRPGPEYGWPFGGYRVLTGHPASTRRLDAEARRRAAQPLALFLRRLHSPEVRAVAAEAGAGFDTIGRLDLAKRIPLVEERLAFAQDHGLVERAAAWDAVMEAVPPDWKPGRDALCHGDLDARHVLVGEEDEVRGVIDWGDVHLGDAAGDLALVHSFLPCDIHDAFRATYGDVDEAVWRIAAFRALHTAIAVLIWAADVGAEDAAEEARVALGYLER